MLEYSRFFLTKNVKKYFGTWNSCRKSQVVGKLRCRIAQVPLYKVNYMMPDVGQRAPKKKVDGLEFCKNHQCQSLGNICVIAGEGWSELSLY